MTSDQWYPRHPCIREFKLNATPYTLNASLVISFILVFSRGLNA